MVITGSKGRRWWLLPVFAVLVFFSLFTIACEEGIEFTFENRTDFDVTILRESIFLSTDRRKFVGMGNVPAGETVKPKVQLITSRNIAGDIVAFEARDRDGNVIWRQTWPHQEFLELEKIDWYICICPEE